MSFPYTPNLKDEKVESLQTQKEYMRLLRLRHLQWMNSADAPGTESMHREIAGLIDEITDRYSHLLDDLQQETTVVE